MKVIEEWKPIKGYENFYEVSNLGKVRSLPRNTTKGKILTLHKQGKGYLFVCLCKEGIRKKYTIHKLVATTFLKNTNNLPCINHIDGNKENNCFLNLEFSTYSHNTKESYKLGLQKPTWKNYKGKKHPRARKVNQYDKEGNLIKTWDCLTDASNELNICLSNIVMCCKHYKKYEYVGGFKWEYMI